MREKTFKLTLLIIPIFLFNQVYSQISLDTMYPNASLKLYMVNLEISGMKYLVKEEAQGNRSLKFYDLNHSLWKTIDCNSFPAMAYCGFPGINYNFDALYISETLFNCDSIIEFLYFSSSDCGWFTGIYNELGVSMLLADSCAPFVKLNVPQQWRPIYNTPNGTKLILSHKNGSANVYDLPCTLSTGIDAQLSNNNGQTEMNIFPNPSFYETTIKFSLPKEINEAELTICDSEGRELRRFTVDKNFDSLLLSQNEFSPGVYVYSLVSANKVLISRKVVLNK